MTSPPFDREWRPVDGFEGLYEVSNYGEVKSLERLELCKGKYRRRGERILKENRSAKMHCTVVLCKDGVAYPQLVHRLVAKAFIPNPDGKPNVDHIDTDPSNNRVDNLRWVSQHENAMNPLTRVHNSLSKMRHRSYYKGFTEETREKLRQAQLGRKASQETRKKLSEIHKTSEKCIAQTASLNHRGQTWAVVDGKRVWSGKEESA